ncbi:MAG: hypothetical protein RLW62_05875, partial [Gammaproteobacteria bacterium]
MNVFASARVRVNRGRAGALPLVALCAAAPGMVAASEVEDFVSGELRRLSDTPVQSAVGTVIGQICPSGTIITDADLQARCDEIAVAGVVNANDTAGAREALQAMGAEEGAAVASTQVDARSGQIDAIGQRLTTLRGGAPALAARPGSFNFSGGAAGDGAGMPWGFFVSGNYASTDRDTTAREAGFE